MHEISEIRAPVVAGERHGGNLAEARRLFPLAPEPWLDLSAAANPHAYPFAELRAETFARLPEEADLRRLESAAAEFYGAADAAWVVAAPGTQALIQWLPQILRARQVGVLGFTYGEHARAWRNAGAHARICENLEELADVDVAVVVNPNNPDGRLVPAADLAELAGHLARRGGFLVVDEAFIDFLPREASLVLALPSAGSIVLRSFGKTFGLPGLRLGFAIAPRAICAKLRAALGPWPVSGAAIAIGREAFADSTWLAARRVHLAADVAQLDAILAEAGFTPVGGTPLFRLVQHLEVAAMFDRLGRAGIWVRRFAERPNWLRFSVPRDGTELRRLRADADRIREPRRAGR
ncbi:MAG: threonine-phosphate decarboxylase CobD [Methylovirgula sp.]